MMPPPITSMRFGVERSSSAPVESTTRGSSGRNGSRTAFGAGGDDALLEGRACRTRPRRHLMGVGVRNLPVPRRPSTLRCLASASGPLVSRRRRLFFQPRSLSRSMAGGEGDAVLGHLLGFGDHLGRVQQRLGRDAADIQADAAERGPAFEARKAARSV
jgi:hypothetical protein